MNGCGASLQRSIDRLVAANGSFALYRLPWTEEPVMVWQTEGEPLPFASACELNGRRGFVLMPFHVTDAHPAVLIRPDEVATGWEAIEGCMERRRLLEDVSIAEKQDCEKLSCEVLAQEECAYRRAFGDFIAPLRQGVFRKLVLSRCTQQALPDGFSPTAAFVRACDSYPRMLITLCHTPGTGTWVGCSPEIILSGNREQWNTVALAGTMPIVGEKIPETWSDKNREEQAYVAAYIRRILQRGATDVEECGPYTARAGGLVHLKTEFRFCLPDASRLGDLLDALHPTPAVCGLPKREAYDFILGHEGYDRQYYSGVIGWLDPEGDTHLYVNLRCMRIGAHAATLYAGGGILPTSVVEAEWEETKEKLKTMRLALGDAGSRSHDIR